MRSLFDHADGIDAYLPVAMIGARFHIADRQSLLRVGYNWNPDLILPSRSKQKLWVFEDWTNDAVEVDPRKAAIMNTLAAWAEEWLPRLQAAFAGRTRATE